MKKKYNKKIQDDLCKYISAGNNKEDACMLVDISTETFYNWQKPEVKDEKTGETIKNKQYHADLADAIKKAEAKCKARNIAVIQSAATGRKLTRKRTLSSGEKVEEEYWSDRPQWTAGAWWLERRYRNEYARREELTGADGEKLGGVIIYKPEKKKEMEK